MGFSLSSLDPTSSSSIPGQILGGITGQTAADAATEAAATTAAAQQQMFEYFQQSEALPQALREGALSQLGGLYGISTTPVMDEAGNITSYDYSFGDPSGQQALIDQAKASPFYQAGLDTGTESVMRTSNVTGGLRGGGGATDIAGFESNLLNKAYNQQLQGLTGLAQMPSTSAQSAQLLGAPGITTGQGQLAAGQATQDAFGNIMNLGGTLGAAAISDKRLKTAITKIGTTSHPYIDKYEWEWLENDLGKEGKETGYIAQEVEQVFPEFIIKGPDGYKRILKDKLEDRLKELN